MMMSYVKIPYANALCFQSIIYSVFFKPATPSIARTTPSLPTSLPSNHPIPSTVSTLASLEALNSLIARGEHPGEGPLPMNRFRPNVVVTGTDAWAEDDWSRVSIGEVDFRVAKRSGRCVVTTTDQSSGERGKEPLHTLARHRLMDGKAVFGQNLVPLSPGTIRVGDPVRVVG